MSKWTIHIKKTKSKEKLLKIKNKSEIKNSKEILE